MRGYLIMMVVVVASLGLTACGEDCCADTCAACGPGMQGGKSLNKGSAPSGTLIINDEEGRHIQAIKRNHEKEYILDGHAQERVGSNS